MGITPMLPAVEVIFGRNGIWKLFRDGDNPKQYAVRLNFLVWSRKIGLSARAAVRASRTSRTERRNERIGKGGGGKNQITFCAWMITSKALFAPRPIEASRRIGFMPGPGPFLSAVLPSAFSFGGDNPELHRRKLVFAPADRFFRRNEVRQRDHPAHASIHHEFLRRAF